MTPIVLVDTLISYITDVVADFDLDSNVSGVSKVPQVIGGYLKEKKPAQQQDPPDFPYVIVRFIEDTDDISGDIAQVQVICGTYSEDAQNGWRDCVNVATRVKDELLKKKFIGGPFKVEYPVKIQLPEEQPFPEWVAILSLTVSIPHVQEEGGYVKDVFN